MPSRVPAAASAGLSAALPACVSVFVSVRAPMRAAMVSMVRCHWLTSMVSTLSSACTPEAGMGGGSCTASRPTAMVPRSTLGVPCAMSRR